MIEPEKKEHALWALSEMMKLIAATARRRGAEEIADLVAAAVVLPRHIAVPEDRTAVFRQTLQEIVAQFPNCIGVLQQFDFTEGDESSIW